MRVTQTRDPILLACDMVRDFARQMLPAPEAADRLALVVHELLLNAERYGNDDTTDLEVDVCEEGHAHVVTIQSRNRAEANHREALAEVIGALERAPDAFTYYRHAMQKSELKSGSSGLGLARVCAEAEVSMSCDLEGDEARVIACARL